MPYNAKKKKASRAEPASDAMRQAYAFVRKENEDDLKQVLQLAKEMDARSRTMFIKIHNYAVEVQELNKKYDAVLGLLKELFARPDQLTHAEHVISDFIQKKYKQGAS